MDEAKEEEGSGEVKNKGGRPRKRYKRKKQPPKLSRRKLAVARRAQKKRYEDPEQYDRSIEILAKARRARSPDVRLGVPDGWTRETADMQRVRDGLQADLLMDRMKAEGMIDDTKPDDFEVVTIQVNGKDMQVRLPKTEAGMAEAALREALIGALSPLTYSKDKLGMIRTVLEYTKKKPATDSNVNLNAEEWLDAALKENDVRDGSAEGSAS
jgi:hypothetical protein